MKENEKARAQAERTERKAQVVEGTRRLTVCRRPNMTEECVGTEGAVTVDL